MPRSISNQALNLDFVPNVAGAQQNALVTQRMGLENQLLGQQVQNAPKRMAMDEQALAIQELANDIKLKTLQQKDQPGPVTLDYPKFTLTGEKGAMIQAAEKVAQFPDQVNDPGFMPWLASIGISVEAKETGGGGTIREGLDEQGNPVVYRVNDQNEVEIIKGISPTPKKGMKVYDRDGNLIIDTGGGKGEGKILPAGVVGKISEFKAYTETLDSIDKVIEDLGGTTKGKTGYFEFINKRLDNWEVWPNEDRINLRSLVARLPGLMYAMRGKQLSDKELEVALDMMPQMELGPTAFLIQLNNFRDYLQKVLQGKKEAFGAAGYNVEGVIPEINTADDYLNKWNK